MESVSRDVSVQRVLLSLQAITEKKLPWFQCTAVILHFTNIRVCMYVGRGGGRSRETLKAIF